MITSNKPYKYLLGVSLLAFLAFALYILYINQEVLYAAHDRSEFIYGAPYFHDLMARPFGLMQYVGAWLTQLLCSPAVGAGVLVAIWTAIFLIGVKAFRLQGAAVALMLVPVACLLTSVVDVGYWIYIMTIRGYWFSQSVGYLLMLLFLWGASSTPRKWHIAWYVLGLCLYPALGWFALLFVFCLMLVEKTGWWERLVIFLAVFIADIWHSLLYAHLPLESVKLAGLPCFETPSDASERLSVPFWVLGCASILIAMLGRYLYGSLERWLNRWFVPVVCAAIGIAFTLSQMFYNKNYIDEMRMVRLAEEDDWKEVLNAFEGASEPTISMVMLKNVALMHEGGLLDRSFKMGNDAVPIYNPDSVHVSFLEIAAPITYYNYGLVNEAFRLSFECAVQGGFSPFYMKVLTRSALANNEAKVAERYTDILCHRPFHSDWQPAPVASSIKEMRASYPDELTGVENSDAYLVTSLSLWYDTDSKAASEQALFYSMLRCDSKRFWASLRRYVKLHMDEDFPLHAQEAYIMFLDKAPEEKRMMLPVTQEIYDRYQQFWLTLKNLVKSGMSRDAATEKMRAEFGDTYWYYNLFGRKIY